MSETKNNNIAYHYCSLETFKSIIENQCFWLCDVQKSNDSAELIYFYDKMIETLDKMIDPSKHDTPQYDKDALQQMKTALQNTKFQTTPVYSCSFSTNGDLLSQWRGYADDGFGLAIGVDCSAFSKFINRFVDVRSVQYGDTIAHESCKITIENIFSDTEQLPYPESTRQYLICQYTLLNHAFYKSFAFQEEEERRIVLLEDNKALVSHLPYLSERKYRITHHQLVSYHELRFGAIKDDLLCKIILGPKCQTKPDDIRMFLRDCGYQASNIDIVLSEATYR